MNSLERRLSDTLLHASVSYKRCTVSTLYGDKSYRQIKCSLLVHHLTKCWSVSQVFQQNKLPKNCDWERTLPFHHTTRSTVNEAVSNQLSSCKNTPVKTPNNKIVPYFVKGIAVIFTYCWCSAQVKQGLEINLTHVFFQERPFFVHFIF